eukprot:SAG22_NODE_300_length_12752_cov_3.102426_6_plen_192_part_00
MLPLPLLRVVLPLLLLPDGHANVCRALWPASGAGWKTPLAEILVVGQMGFSYAMHLLITLALPLQPSSKRMLVVEDLLMLAGLFAIFLAMTREWMDGEGGWLDGWRHGWSRGPTGGGGGGGGEWGNAQAWHWVLFLLLQCARVGVQRAVRGREGWSIPPWAVRRPADSSTAVLDSARSNLGGGAIRTAILL